MNNLKFISRSFFKLLLLNIIMFSKKCARCGKRIKKGFSYCPNCGYAVREQDDEKDYGLLGKNDDFEDLGIKLPMGLNMVFKTLIKELDKQFKDLDRQTRQSKADFKPIKNGFSISINSGINPSIKLNKMGKEMHVKNVKKNNMKKREQRFKKMIGLPREEAETKVRRLSNKIVYEIELPGVKSINDIIINKLENSIEVKALAKNKVLVKLLPISLPIVSYKLDKETLILELKN